MNRDPDVFLMGEDVGRWGSLYRSSRGLLEKFRKELRDELGDTLLRSGGLVRELISRRAIEKLIADHQRGGRDGVQGRVR